MSCFLSFNFLWHKLTTCIYLLSGVVADSEETIKASADALGRLGFINYFGLQVRSYSFLFTSWTSFCQLVSLFAMMNTLPRIIPCNVQIYSDKHLMSVEATNWHLPICISFTISNDMERFYKRFTKFISGFQWTGCPYHLCSLILGQKENDAFSSPNWRRRCFISAMPALQVLPIVISQGNILNFVSGLCLLA